MVLMEKRNWLLASLLNLSKLQPLIRLSFSVFVMTLLGCVIISQVRPFSEQTFLLVKVIKQLAMAVLYSSVLVSRDNMTVTQHTQY